mgnify:CR=1 FL=1
MTAWAFVLLNEMPIPPGCMLNGAPAAGGAYGGNNFGAQPAYAGKPPADYYSAPTGAGGFSSAPPSLPLLPHSPSSLQ